MSNLIKNNGLVPAVLILMALVCIGCGRGLPFEEPPTSIDRGMSNQPKYNPQSECDFFADKAEMRVPVAGTVAQGGARLDDAYYRGQDSAGNFVPKAPISTTMQVLKRGQERFNIYCSPCHSRLGDGKGIVVNHGYIPPPSYHSDRLRKVQDGYLFDVISNGVRNMPSYGHQVPVADRWPIVLYIRALQLSQNAPINDVPEEVRPKLK